MKERKWHSIEVVDAPGYSKILDADGYSITGVICTNTAKRIVALNNKDVLEKNNINTNKQKILWRIEKENNKTNYINI